ncbi:MAG: antitoxin [Vicinamibacteria bacterium]
MPVKTAKIFRSGNSQAVRIPKEFQLDGRDVEIEKTGDSLVLRPRRRSWAPLVESLVRFSSGFMEEGRNQPADQKREEAFS